uniref:Uncharacterized protein n=1 Tax=Meloidogyne enterolobii TaxID=390850 RepID=A0A6V7TSN5_MELEN|nr:unnamed protein product [Meloidogyne enterolobii]
MVDQINQMLNQLSLDRSGTDEERMNRAFGELQHILGTRAGSANQILDRATNRIQQQQNAGAALSAALIEYANRPNTAPEMRALTAILLQNYDYLQNINIFNAAVLHILNPNQDNQAPSSDSDK